MASERANHAARIMDAERTRIENIGLRAVVPTARRMRLEAVRAYRSGGDIASTIRSAMTKVAGDMADGMLAADLSARLRTRVIHKKATGLKLSVYADAVSLLEARLGLSDAQIEALRTQYKSSSVSATNEIGTVLEREVQRAVAQAVSDGLPTRAGADLVRQAFDSAGVAADNPYLFETIYRTQLQTAYSAARWQANQAPEIQEILWGYEYAAVMDDRTTSLCSDLDGQRHPKGSDFWSRFTPPNHYGCRSQIIEIFNDERMANATASPDVLPAVGFDNNPGEVFASLVG